MLKEHIFLSRIMLCSVLLSMPSCFVRRSSLRSSVEHKAQAVALISPVDIQYVEQSVAVPYNVVWTKLSMTEDSFWGAFSCGYELTVLSDFYMREMERLGWKLNARLAIPSVDHKESPEVALIWYLFEKPHSWCWVRLNVQPEGMCGGEISQMSKSLKTKS